MNNDFLYNENEWKEIEEYAFSDEMPEPQFSESYKKRREEIISSVNNEHKRIKRSSVISAVIAAAVLIPTTAFAVEKIGTYIEQTGKYEKTVHIYQEEISCEQIMGLNFGWIPEGMGYNSDSGKYTDILDPDSGRIITPVFWKIIEGENFSVPVRYSAAHEVYTSENGATVFIIKKDTGSDQLWVIFNDTPYVAQIYVKGFDSDEIKQLADGLSLVPSDTETAAIWQEPEAVTLSKAEAEITHEIKDMNLCTVGDTIYQKDMEIHIDSVEIQENFYGVTTDCIGLPTDYSDHLDQSGKITDERILIELGDGVNTLDTELSREKVTRSVIVMKLTGTNKSETSQNLRINPKMFRLADETIVGLSEPSISSEQNYAVHYNLTDRLDTDDSAFSFYANSENTEKNSVILQSGESVSVQLAFIADNDYLDSIYFDMLYQGGYVEESISGGNPVLKLK